MKITDILVPEAVISELKSSEKRGVLEEMVHGLVQAVPSIDEGQLLDVLVERESLQSTGIGEGVAIPHGKLAGISDLMAGFARSSSGVNFDSIDGAPTTLFFLLVVPEQSGGHHLKALARISRFLRDESFRKKLVEASGVEDILRAIQEEDEKI